MQVRTFFKAIVGLVGLLASASAHAQSDPGSLARTVPQLPANQAPKEAVKVTAPAAEKAQAGIAQTFILSAVIVEGATVFNSGELAQHFEPYLASRVGQAELDKIAAAMTERYRRAGYLLSYAMVPEQSVQSGIVRIRIVEGFVGNVRLAGNRRAAAAVSKLFEGLAAERPLRGETLERTIGLARDIPSVTISDVQIGRSTQDPARHALTVLVGGDRVRALAYVDNRGTIQDARLRAFSSFSLSSLAVAGDQLQLDLFAIPYAKFRYAYGQVKASVPLGTNGLRLSASASYGDQFQRLPGPNQDGFSRQLSAELAYPFAKSRAFSLSGHLMLADWKSESEISGALVQRDRIQVARAWLEFSRAADLRIDGRLGVSRGLDLGSASDGGTLASRPFADSTFTKFNAALQLSTPLSERVRISMDSIAQYSAEPLLAPEEFALGGSRIGRAFDFNEVAGDHGVGAMIELAYRLPDTKMAKNLEVFAFVDGGGAFREQAIPGFRKKEWLASVGTGARFFALGTYWSGEVGVPLARTGADRDIRAFFSTTKAF